jgi:hypothetical protein
MKLSVKQKLLKSKVSKYPLNDMGMLPVIPWKMILDTLGKTENDKFMRWMNGQTCSPYGVYPQDMERYIKGNKVID